MASLRKIKIIAITAGICVGLSLLFLSFLLFYYISFLTSSIGAILLYILMLWLLLRLAVKILVFPGSCWFWKRSIEASFCVEMSNQIYYKIRDLRCYIQAIQNQEKFLLQNNTSFLIETMSERLKSMKTYKVLSKFQDVFLKRLEDIKQTLQETMVIINSETSRSLFDWISDRLTKPEPNDIVYEDYPDCHHAKKLVKACTELEAALFSSCGTVKLTEKVKRWMFDDTLGSIHYLREDLIKKFRCEQIWIQCEKSRIDCLLINNSSEGNTMIFCNPNAGFYEFSYYQSEWFEFYMRLGVNLLMWNYPGYGRSPGPPSLKRILKYGETIVAYLREVKHVKVIGVHGESLGGCVATYLANKCGLNFLFADRTFSSLCSAARFNFGKIAYCAFKIAARDDSDSANNYLQARCYKIVSCDPRDNMINDLASLKSGVAGSLLYKSFPRTHILIPEHMKAFFGSLSRINSLASKLGNLSRESNSAPSQTYQPLNEDNELFENEKFKETLLKLKMLLNGIEAGGMSLLGIFKTKYPQEALISWVMVIDVWGSNVFSRINPIQNAVDSLRGVIRELEGVIDVNGLQNEITAVHLGLDAIKSHLEARIESSDSRSLSTSQEFKNDVDYDKAGHLIPLTCGHGGPFSSQERLCYEQHLSKARFI